MGIFHDKGQMLVNATTLFDPAVTSSYLLQLKPLATAGLSIYLLWLMIPLLIGNSEYTAHEAMMKLIVWSIIWTFTFNGSGYLTMVQNGMNEIFTWAGGGIGFFDNLDTWSDTLRKASDTIYKMDSNYFKLQGWLAQAIIIFGALILTLVPFAIIIYASLGVQVIVMLAPFMILSLIFPVTKEMFYNALGIFITLVLNVLIISIIQKSLVIKIDKFVNGVVTTLAAGGGTSIISIAINILILCLIYTLLMYASVPISKSIPWSVS